MISVDRTDLGEWSDSLYRADQLDPIRLIPTAERFQRFRIDFPTHRHDPIRRRFFTRLLKPPSHLTYTEPALAREEPVRADLCLCYDARSAQRRRYVGGRREVWVHGVRLI